MSERHYHSGYLSVSSRGTDYRIPIDSILYIESNNRKLTIHTEEETYSCYEKLNVMEQNLYLNILVLQLQFAYIYLLQIGYFHLLFLLELLFFHLHVYSFLLNLLFQIFRIF